MASLLERLIGRKEPTSAEIAKERLKLVLVTDRSNLPPEKLEAMQLEILEVIKRYLEIDELQVKINFEQRDRKHYLVADIPLQRDRSYGAGIEYPGPPPAVPDRPRPAVRPNKFIEEPPVSTEDTIPHRSADGG